MKKIVTTLAVVATISLLSGVVLAATGVVNTEELNLRKEASTESEAIDGLVKGDEVNIISEEGDWYKVTVNGQDGYVSKKYIKEKDENTTTNTSTEEPKNTTSENTTTNNVVNEVNTTTEPVKQQTTNITTSSKVKLKEITALHVLPLINSTSLGFIDANVEALLISINGKWAYIQTSTQSGWILTNKLDITNVNSSTDTTNNNGTETNTTTDDNTSKDNKTIMYVNSESINVREEATTSSEVVTTLSKNTEVTITGKEGDWYKVETSKGNGYIKEELLSENKE